MSRDASALSFLASASASVLLLLGCGGAASNSSRAPTPGAPGAPTAAAALAETAAALAGRWSCRGRIYGPGGAASESEVALEVGLALDEAWLQSELVVLAGDYKYKFTSHRTFDAASRSWVNVIVDNFGGYARSRSTDAITWTGESMGPMGKMTIRDTETLASPGELRMLGQYALEDGTWRTGYDLTCQR